MKTAHDSSILLAASAPIGVQRKIPDSDNGAAPSTERVWLKSHSVFIGGYDTREPIPPSDIFLRISQDLTSQPFGVPLLYCDWHWGGPNADRRTGHRTNDQSGPSRQSEINVTLRCVNDSGEGLRRRCINLKDVDPRKNDRRVKLPILNDSSCGNDLACCRPLDCNLSSQKGESARVCRLARDVDKLAPRRLPKNRSQNGKSN